MTTTVSKVGWKKVKFGEIAENIAVRIDPGNVETDIYVGLEHLDSGSLHLQRWGHPSDVIGEKLAFQKGDVIFGRRRAYQRKLAVAEFDGICSAHAMVLRAKSETILPEFLPFFLQSDTFMQQAEKISVGSLSPTINWNTLRGQEFALPPLEEQNHIAQLLWAADSNIQNWRTALRILGRTMGVISSHLLDLPGVRLVKLGHMVDDHQIEIINGPFGTVLKANSYVTEGTPLVNPTHIQDGFLDLAKSPRLSGADVKRLAKYLTLRGDILLGRKGDMDKVLFIDDEHEGVITGTDCLRLRVLSNALNPRYLYAWLRSTYVFAWLSRFAHGTTMPGINEKTLHLLDVPVIARGDQDQIVEKLGHMEQSRTMINEHIRATEILQRTIVGSTL